MIWKLVKMIGRFSEQAGRKNISVFASSAAFFLFLSIVPMLILLCTIIPYTPLTEENLVAAVTEVVPEVIAPLAVSLVSEVYDQSVGILSLAALTMLWSAGKGVLALMRGLNAVNNVEENRNYFLVRFIATFYTLIMLVVVILSLFLMVFGNQLMQLVTNHIPQIKVLVSFLMNFRFMAVWAILTVLFGAIYAYVPDRKLRFREQLPGASLAAVAWSVFSWGFSLYVGRSRSYSIYGSLSIIIIAMIWMYVCMYIIFMGACLNCYLETENGENERKLP